MCKSGHGGDNCELRCPVFDGDRLIQPNEGDSYNKLVDTGYVQPCGVSNAITHSTDGSSASHNFMGGVCTPLPLGSDPTVGTCACVDTLEGWNTSADHGCRPSNCANQACTHGDTAGGSGSGTCGRITSSLQDPTPGKKLWGMVVDNHYAPDLYTCKTCTTGKYTDASDNHSDAACVATPPPPKCPPGWHTAIKKSVADGGDPDANPPKCSAIVAGGVTFTPGSPVGQAVTVPASQALRSGNYFADVQQEWDAPKGCWTADTFAKHYNKDAFKMGNGACNMGTVAIPRGLKAYYRRLGTVGWDYSGAWKHCSVDKDETFIGAWDNPGDPLLSVYTSFGVKNPGGEGEASNQGAYISTTHGAAGNNPSDACAVQFYLSDEVQDDGARRVGVTPFLPDGSSEWTLPGDSAYRTPTDASGDAQKTLLLAPIPGSKDEYYELDEAFPWCYPGESAKNCGSGKSRALERYTIE